MTTQPVDPVTTESMLLGVEAAESMLIESRMLMTLLDSGQSPTHIDRVSPSHARPLMPQLVALVFWQILCTSRRDVGKVCDYMKTC